MNSIDKKQKYILLFYLSTYQPRDDFEDFILDPYSVYTAQSSGLLARILRSTYYSEPQMEVITIIRKLYHEFGRKYIFGTDKEINLSLAVTFLGQYLTVKDSVSEPFVNIKLNRGSEFKDFINGIKKVTDGFK